MEIRKSTETDVEDVLNVQMKAFGFNKGCSGRKYSSTHNPV